MRWPIGILGLAVAIVAVAVAIITRGEVPGQSGLAHPEIAEMARGGEAVARHGELLGLAWLLGALVLGLCALLVAGGGRRRAGLGRVLVAGFVIQAAAWTAVVVTYAETMGDPAPATLVGMPWPTALLVWALWPAPVAFVVAYVVGFDRWVMGREGAERFARLLQERRAREEG
jgi:hypothetical protein